MCPFQFLWPFPFIWYLLYWNYLLLLFLQLWFLPSVIFKCVLFIWLQFCKLVCLHWWHPLISTFFLCLGVIYKSYQQSFCFFTVLDKISVVKDEEPIVQGCGIILFFSDVRKLSISNCHLENSHNVQAIQGGKGKNKLFWENSAD